jgi:RNA polymerase sigma-70 factor (ECF subfamily)
VSSGAHSASLEGGGIGRPVGRAAGAEPAVPESVYAGLSDLEIMLRVKAGDDAAFDYLVSKFRRPLVGFMYRMSGNQAVAEELAQEVFLRVYRSRAGYRADAKFTTWLYRIAMNLAVNHARDTRKERAGQVVSLEEPDDDGNSRIDVADHRATAEQRMLERERVRTIRRHIQSLPERQRMAVIMHKYQELDYREIGEVLSLSESATKSLLFRAYGTLRERLKEFV